MDPSQTGREKLVSAGLLKKTKNQHIWKNLFGVIKKTTLILTVAACNQGRSLACEPLGYFFARNDKEKDREADDNYCGAWGCVDNYTK